MAESKLSQIKKKRNEEEASSSSSTLSRIRSNREFNGFANIGSDLENTNNMLSTVYGGWQTQGNMNNYKSQLDSTYRQLSAYSDVYGNLLEKDQQASINDTIKSYGEILKNWDSLSGMYGMYKNADAYNAAKKKQDIRDKYKGKSYEEIQQALNDSTDVGERNYLKSFTDYSTAEDFDKAINAIPDREGMTSAHKKNLKKAKSNFEATQKFADDKEANDKAVKAYTNFTNQNGLIKALATPVNAAISAISPLVIAGEEIVEGIGGAFGGEGYNPYKYASGLSRMANASTQAITEDINNRFGKLGAIGYEAISSGIPSRIGQRLFGGAYNVLMGVGSFATTYADALESGMSVEDAAMKAFAAGAVETLTEQLGMDWAFGEGKDAIGTVLRQFLAEGSEEVVGNLTNAFLDARMNGRNADLAKQIQFYSSLGYTDEEARSKVIKEFAMDTAEAFMAAGLSAGAEGGIHAVGISNAGSGIDSEMLAQYSEKNGIDKYMELLGDNEELSNYQKGVVYGEAVAKNNEALKGAKTDIEYESALANRESLKAMGKGEVKTDFKIGKESGIKATDVVSENGEKFAVDESGTKHNLSEIEMSEREAKLYEVASVIEDETLRKEVLDYDGNDIDSYARNVELINQMSNKGFKLSDVLSAVNQNVISSEKATEIYNIASNISINNNIQARKNAEAITQKWNGKYKAGKFDVSEIDVNSLSKNEKSLVGFLQMFSGMGMNIKVINDANEKSDNGTTVGGQIVINLKARYFADDRSDEGKYAVATFAHESTHWMKNVLGDEFDTLKAVAKQSIGTRRWEIFTAQEISNSKKKKLTVEEAEEEVIARLCEDMLNNPDNVDRILSSATEGQIKRLIKAIKKWFTELKADIQNLLKGYSSDSFEAKYLRQFESEFEAVEKTWLEMFEKALKLNQTLDNVGIELDENGYAYEAMNSEKTFRNSEYAKDIDSAAKALADKMECTVEEAKKYIKDVGSIANKIAKDRNRLDYLAIEDKSAWVSNPEYGGSLDYSFLCPKRLTYTGTMNAILKKQNDLIFSVDDFLFLRRSLIKSGYEAPCSFCFVESARARFGKYNQKFLEIAKEEGLEYIPTAEELTNPDELERLKKEHRESYDRYEKYLNSLSQRKPKMLEERRAYNGDILKAFKGKEATINSKNLHGGIRFNSFSDFEVVHMIDCMQAILDMSRVGLAGFGYTKQKAFAEVFGKTGLKINLSCVAKGVDEKGRIIFDDIEGMNSKDALKLRNGNVGICCVVFTDEQMRAALCDDRIDYVLPFHRSQWSKKEYERMGLSLNTKDFTRQQTEKLGTKKAPGGNIPFLDYWNRNLTGEQTVQKYLDILNRDGKTPMFSPILEKVDGKWVMPKGQRDAKGRFINDAERIKEEAGKNYWKLLCEFKLYDSNGNALPQMPVQPTFDMNAANRILREYDGSHKEFPVAQNVVDDFMKFKSEGKSDILPEWKTMHSDKVDSEGNALTEDVARFFAKSKVRDENGNLMVMYHGSHNDFGFTVFNSDESDDGRSFFFTDLKKIAQSYASSNKSYKDPNTYTLSDLKKIVENTFDRIEKKGEVYQHNKYTYGPEFVRTEFEGSFEELRDYILEEYDDSNGRGYYEVYLNLTNPLIVECDYNQWDELPAINNDDTWTTREYSEHAKENGYDGVIFKNIYDAPGNVADSQTVVVAFNSNQIKSVDNENPTENPDIRYSEKVNSDGDALTEGQAEYFKDSKIRDEDGNLLVVYHGSAEDFTVFDRTKSRANMDIQGNFFSPWEIDAGGYGGNVRAFYLNIKNPASESMGYKALNKFKGQNYAGVKAREYLESLGYDGVNNGNEEYIAFYPEQIKEISNENPTEDSDIRYSEKVQENPALKTLNGSKIQRSKYGVGKQMGSQIYVHKNYAGEIIPSDVWAKAKKLLSKNFEYNCVMWDEKNPNVVRFDEAPDFDTAREPKPGKMKKVDTTSGEVADAKGNGNMIWHHKWEWVRNDYEGFDVKESYEWSREWLEKISNPSGSLRVWNELLRENNLPIDTEDNTMYSLKVVKPFKPASDKWQSGHSEKWFIENGFPVREDVSEEWLNARKAKGWKEGKKSFAEKGFGGTSKKVGTQISSTESTYGKIYDYLESVYPHGEWKKLRILDASSGLGMGTRLGLERGFDVTDIEPYVHPDSDYMPDYMDYSSLQDKVENGEVKPFDFVISNAVLNVIPQDSRDNMVSWFSSVLADGGKLYVNTLDANYTKNASAEINYDKKGNIVGQVLTQKGNNGAGNEVFVGASQSVQKGFSNNELRAYLQDALGDNFEVTAPSFKAGSGATAVATKLYKPQVINWYKKKTGPYEARITKEAVSFLSKYAYNYDIERQEYAVLHSAVLTNNYGKMHANTIGVETTSNYIYLYVVDSNKNLRVFYGEPIEGNNITRKGYAEAVADSVSELWDDEERSLSAYDASERTRKHRDIVEAVREVVENRQRYYFLGNIYDIEESSDEFGRHLNDEKMFSEKVTKEDYFGQNKRLESENAKLKEDIARLGRMLRLQKNVTKGKILDEKKLELAAKVILKDANSTYDKAELIEGLKDVYGYIIDNSNKEILWDEVMNKASVVAKKVLDASKPEKITDDYYKGILSDLRKARIKLSEEEIKELKSWYGDDYRKDFFGKIMLTKDGRSIDSYWSEWSSAYPEIFKADTNPMDQITQILNIYDDLKDLSSQIVKYNDSESVRAMAVEIYNKFWNVPTVTTVADKYDAEIKKLNFEHRQAMKNLKDSQKLADQIHYGKAMKQLRDRKEEQFIKYKQYKKDQADRLKDASARSVLVKQITKQSSILMDWMAKNSAKEHIPEALKPVVTQLLESIDFSSKQLLGLKGGMKIGQPTKKDISLRKAIDRLSDLVQKSSTEEGMAELGRYIDFPPTFADDLNTIKKLATEIAVKTGEDNVYILNMMTVDELSEVYNMVKVMKMVVQNLNKKIASANKASIAEEAQIDLINNKKLGNKKYTKAFKFFEYDNALPIYAFEHLGVGASHMFEEVQDGWDKFAFNIKEVVDYAHKTFSGKQRKEWSEHINEVTVTVVPDEREMKAGGEIHEEKAFMTDAQIMSIYCLAKREHAKTHFNGGGIRLANIKNGKGEIVQTQNIRLNEEELGKLFKLLTKEQKEVADKLQEFMNTTCKDWGNEVSMKRFGIKGFNEENYFPIKVDSNVLATENRDNEKSIYALLNMGFTKPIVPRATAQMEIGDIFDVFTTHASDMAKYNSIALPVLDMVKWYNYKEKDADGNVSTIKGSIEQAHGASAKAYIMHFLNDLNGNSESGRGDSMMRKLTRNFKVAAVAANLQVALLQPISILRASAVIEEKYLASGMANVAKVKHGMEMCQKYSGIAVWKGMSLFDTNVSRGLDAMIKQDDSLYDKVIELSMKGAEKADEITWGAIWNACEAEVKDKQKLEGEELYKATAKRFRDVVYRTQVVDSTMTRTDIMRSKSLAAQWATSFMSEPSITMNLFQDLIIKYSQDVKQYGYKEAVKKNRMKLLKVGEAFIACSIAESVLRGIVGKYRKPDDDEELYKVIWDEFKQNLNLLNNIPIARDVVSIFSGYKVERPDVAFAQNMYYAYTGLAKNGITYKNMYRLATTLSQITGLPIGSFMREFEAALQYVIDIGD